jgi:hypothetical protein
MSMIARTGIILSTTPRETFSATWSDRVKEGFLESIARNRIDVTSLSSSISFMSDASNISFGAQTVSNCMVIGSNSVRFNVPVETTLAVGGLTTTNNVIFIGSNDYVDGGGVAVGNDNNRMLQWSQDGGRNDTPAWRVLGGALQVNNDLSNFTYNLHVNTCNELELYSRDAKNTPNHIIVFCRVIEPLEMPASVNRYR